MTDRETQLSPGVAIAALLSLATTFALIGAGFLFLLFRGPTP